jgi:hypothetical protein
MGGHVLEQIPELVERDNNEMERVAKKGGTVIYCPGNIDRDDAAGERLVLKGYRWSKFEEPTEGWRRKYWKTL